MKTAQRRLLSAITAGVFLLPLLTVASAPAAAEDDATRAAALVSDMAAAGDEAEAFYNALTSVDQDLVRAALTPATVEANSSVDGAGLAPYDSDATNAPYVNTIGSTPSAGGCISTNVSLQWKSIFGELLFEAALLETFCDNGLQVTSMTGKISHGIHTVFWSYQGGDRVASPTPTPTGTSYGDARFAIKIPFITIIARTGNFQINYTPASGAFTYFAS